MIFDEPSLQDELDELNERDKMSMVLVEDIIEVWMVVFSEPYPDEQKEELKTLTAESLQVYWGPKAWVEVKDGTVFLKHKDGRELARFVAF